MFSTVNKATVSEIWFRFIVGNFVFPFKRDSWVAQGKIQPTSRSSPADRLGNIGGLSPSFGIALPKVSLINSSASPFSRFFPLVKVVECFFFFPWLKVLELQSVFGCDCWTSFKKNLVLGSFFDVWWNRELCSPGAYIYILPEILQFMILVDLLVW